VDAAATVAVAEAGDGTLGLEEDAGANALAAHLECDTLLGCSKTAHSQPPCKITPLLKPCVNNSVSLKKLLLTIAILRDSQSSRKKQELTRRSLSEKR